MRDAVAILDNIRSAWNVGSIFRTADAAGVSKLYLAGITPAPVDRFGRTRADLAKVALGSERTVPWEAVRSAARLVERLKREGYRVYAVEQAPRSTPLFRFAPRRSERVALVLGNEIHGLPRAVLARADRILELPMAGSKESLNVAVAFGIVAYHIAFSRKR